MRLLEPMVSQIGDEMIGVLAPAPAVDIRRSHGLRWKRQIARPLSLVALLALSLIVTFGSASASDYVVRDTFNLDTAGTPLPLHTLEVDATGGGWVQSTGSDFRITLDGVAAHDKSLDVEAGITVIDTLVSEYDLTVNVLRHDSDRDAGSVTGVVFRYVDENNHFAAVYDGRRLKLVRVSGGGETVLDERNLSSGNRLNAIGTVHVRHDRITVDIEGRQPLETADGSFADATLAGLIFQSVQTTSFRDFSVSSEEDPPGAEPEPEPSASTVFDTFTAPSGTSLPSHTGTEITSGGPWSTLRGAWQIADGTVTLDAAAPTLPFADQIAVLPAGGQTDQEISTDVTWHGGTAGVVWNASDAQNYSLAFWDGAYVVAGRVEVAVFREFGRQRAVWPAGQTRNLRVRVNGDRARVYLDGSEPLMLAMGLPDPNVLNGGVFVRNGAENRFDNFVVSASQPLAQLEPVVTDEQPFPPIFTETPADAWVFDSFDSPDSALLQDRSPEIDPAGQGWTPVSGLWQIWKAQASEQSGVFGPEPLNRFAVIDTGVDEYELEASVEWDGGRVGVMFGGRVTSAEDAGRNGFLFFRNGDRIEVGRLIGGVYFRIDTSDDFNWTAGQRRTLKVTVEDGEAELSLNDSELFTFTDPALRYSTWAGLFQRGQNDERFNDFTVTLPEGVDPPPDPAVGPIANVEMRAGETLIVPVPIIGPVSFKPELRASATRLPDRLAVFDSFSSPAGADVLLTGREPDLGLPGAVWTQVRPGLEATVDGGALMLPIGGDGGDQRVVIETGYADVEVSAVVTAELGRAGLVARHDGSLDDANWLMGWVDTESGLLFLGQKLSGEFRLLRYAPFSWASGETRAMSMTVTGTDVTLSVDGLEILAATVAAELSGTHAGLFARSFLTVGIFDDFRVAGLGLPNFISLEDDPSSGPSLRIAPHQQNAGSYEVVVDGEQANWSVTTSFMLTVIPLAGPTSDAGGPYVSPEGSPVSLDGSGSSAGDSAIVEFAWDVDGDGVPDLHGATADFHPLRTGAHEVRLTLTDENGLTSHATTNVTVVPASPEVNLAEMVLAGDAVISGNSIVLTPDVLWQVGAAWMPTTHAVTTGFTATFSFQIDAGPDPGADGIAFAIQRSVEGNAAIGSAGDGIGYSTVENSLVIEFDTWVGNDALHSGNARYCLV